MIEPERIAPLNDEDVRDDGRYVLYWMQASQREAYNHALEYAVKQANQLKRPVVACFGLTDEFPEANLRHYTFMLEGLCATQAALAERGIQLVVRRGSPPQVAADLAAEAAMLVADRGYLRVQKQWRFDLAGLVGCRAMQVETDVVVPVDEASDKEEYAARTLRPKTHRLWDRYLAPMRRTHLRRDSLGLRLGGIAIDDTDAALKPLTIDRTVPPSPAFAGGTAQADKRLRRFVADRLAHYHERRNDPAGDWQSDMSPYLHFGQISPIAIALAVRKADGVPDEAVDAYLEELIVRRELSMNFVEHNPRYDAFESLPGWARATLRQHARDHRPAEYSLEQLERAETDDPYWNAAATEMRVTGKMHNYMRMYWGKRIIEWTATPAEAFERAVYLNNRWELDGRDPNSFAGVAWCFGKHDRPWAERSVFGTVRTMTAGGLERKFDMDAYAEKVRRLAER